VDGYNVLRVSLSESAGTSWWSEERRAALGEIAARLPYPDDEILLVFDARHLAEPQVDPAGDAGRVRRVFAPSADEWIVATLKRRAGGETRVVTADRSLANRARHCGAEVMATDAFLSLCGESAAGA